jgi:hypothetical protein
MFTAHRSTSWPPLVACLCAAALLGACASARGPTRTGEEPDESIAGYPYSRNQLREAFVVGSRINLRIEDKGKIHYEDLEVVAADGAGCTMTTKVVTQSGQLVEDKGTETRTWHDLQAEASHPIEETVIIDGTIKSFMGEIETWLYLHTSKGDDGRETQTYRHYAKDLPGPPVLETTTVDGKLVRRVTMIGRR